MTQVYKLVKDNDHINILGEQGWNILVQDPTLLSQGFPIIIAKEFRLHRDSKVIDDIAVRWLEGMANKSEENLKELKKLGFYFKKVYSETEDKYLFRAEKRGKSILNWRIEVNYGEDEPIAYITFGSPMLMAPALANKEVIDLYCPKKLIEDAVSKGALFVTEVEEQQLQEEVKEDAGLDKGEQRKD